MLFRSPTIVNCNFINNYYAIENTAGNLYFDADSNYWGHITGPYHSTSNPSGHGDTVSTYVDILPFLTEPDTVAPIPVIQNVSVDTFGIDYVDIFWDTSPIGDLAGYKVYLDSVATDVGLDTTYTINNLTPGVYSNVVVTCYDNSGNESWFSNNLVVSPSTISNISAIDTLDFGAVLIGDNTQASLLVSNNGTTDLNITSITSSATEFEPEIANLLVSPSSPGVIPIIFTPTEFGLLTANLTITSDAYNTPDLVIILIGSGDLAPNPAMLSVVDVPDDQGGQVRITFARSKYDGIDSTLQIESYTVWRHIDGTDWDAVEMFNAVQDSVYYYVAPTLCDSTFEGICWSTYKVSAHTHNADVFFWSDSMSGYSIDNIAPGIPTGLIATVSDSGILLVWNMNPEEDFQYFKLYRSNEPDFDPTGMDTYFETIDTSFTDINVEFGLTYYYSISAIDYTGNESEHSDIVNATFLGIDGQANIPKEFGLKQNYPNPFNPVTTISYQLPKSIFVNISIYNISGQLVETLLKEHKSSGYYSVKWNATGVGSGVYFYRIEAGEYTKTKKCLILK